MTTYTTQTDKNGKTLFYRITDGKKNISRAEYEANQATVIEVPAVEPVAEEVTATVATVGETTEQQAVESAEEIKSDFALVELFTPEEYPNQGGEKVYSAEQIPPIEVTALNKVQQIIYSSGDPRKLSIKTTKNFSLILYRGCSILGFMYDGEKLISKISFMGTTAETRKRTTRYEFTGISDIENRREQILEQVGFVNNYLNAVRA
jgi:hypothetical protein